MPKSTVFPEREEGFRSRLYLDDVFTRAMRKSSCTRGKSRSGKQAIGGSRQHRSRALVSQVRPCLREMEQGGPLSGVPFSCFPTRVLLLCRLCLPLPPFSRKCWSEPGVLGQGFALEPAAALPGGRFSQSLLGARGGGGATPSAEEQTLSPLSPKGGHPPSERTRAPQRGHPSPLPKGDTHPQRATIFSGCLQHPLAPSAGPPKISLFFLSLSHRKFQTVFEGQDPQMCMFGLSGCRVNPGGCPPPDPAHHHPKKKLAKCGLAKFGHTKLTKCGQISLANVVAQLVGNAVSAPNANAPRFQCTDRVCESGPQMHLGVALPSIVSREPNRPPVLKVPHPPP